MPVSIREAVPSDYSTICDLLQNELGYHDLDLEKLCTRLEIMKADEKHLTTVAEINGAVVGFIGIYIGIAYDFDGEYIQIIALAVQKSQQNKGIGSQLLKWVEDYGIKHNIRCFGLNSGFKRLEAHAFYEHNGYVKRSYGFRKSI